MRVIIQFVHQFVAFRCADFHAAAECVGTGVQFCDGEEAAISRTLHTVRKINRLREQSNLGEIPESDAKVTPIALGEMNADSDFEGLGKRAFSVACIAEHWAGPCKDIDAVRVAVDAYIEANGVPVKKGETFNFRKEAFGITISPKKKMELFHKILAAPAWHEGTVSLKPEANKQFVLFIVKDVESGEVTYFFGKLLANGPRNQLHQWKLNKRPYIGTTTMNPELAFFTACQAQVKSGSLVLDPFCGTGGLLLACAYYGAYCIGGELNRAVLTGAGKLYNGRVNIRSNFVHHGFEAQFVSLLNADAARSTLLYRNVEIFDAIVADPPYGVREFARQLSAPHENSAAIVDTEDEFANRPGTTAGYSTTQLCRDLLAFAARNLMVGGRLVYWLPTTYEYDDADLALHPCLDVRFNSEQRLSRSMCRRLITMVKVCAFDEALHGNLNVELLGQRAGGRDGICAHANISAVAFPNTGDTRNDEKHVASRRRDRRALVPKDKKSNKRGQ